MTTPLTWTGKPVTISWSGIETWRDCKRSWAFGYIERKRTEKESTEVGSAVHDLAELYLKGRLPWDPATEDPPDRHKRYWRILEPGLLYAPTPEDVRDSGWGVETWVRVPCGPLEFVGKVDIHQDRMALVVDWKTTGDGDYRWSKTPEELAEHGQANLYAYALHHEDPPATLDYQHINMVSRGRPDAMEVWAYDVPWASAAGWWERAKTIAVDMHKTACNYTSAEDVPPDITACANFGGCDHAEYCTASPQNRNLVQTSPTRKPTMSNTASTQERLAKMRAKLGLDKSKAGTITPAPPPPKTEPSKEAKVQLVIGQYQQMLDAGGFVAEQVAVILAESQGLWVSDIITPMGLRLTDGRFVPKEADAEDPFSDVDIPYGTEAKQLQAIAEVLEVTVPDLLTHFDIKVMYGLCVPADWTGSVTEAYQEFLPDTIEATKAAIIDEVDPPVAAKPVPTEPAAEEEAKPRVAADVAPAPAPPASQESEDDENAQAASMLIEAITAAGKPIAKAAAAAVVRQAIPSLQRVRPQRWDAILAASSGDLYLPGNRVGLTRPVPAEEELQALVAEAGEAIAILLVEDVKVVPAEVALASQGLRDRVIDPFAMTPEVEAELDEVATATAKVVEQAGEYLGESAPALPARGEAVFRGPEVFVDCLPWGEDFTNFSDWAGRYERRAAATSTCLHPRCLAGGESRRLVLCEVVEDLNSQGPKALPASMHVPTTHWLANDILPLIEQLGGSVRVIKAVR